MGPTIENNSIIILNQFLRTQDFKKGDIVFFENPIPFLDRIEQSSHEQGLSKLETFAISFVKRLIAIEGDVISIEKGLIYLNGKLLNEPYVIEKLRDKTYIREITIPQGYCLVLGDNRNNSYDSTEFGLIPTKLLRGKVIWYKGMKK